MERAGVTIVVPTIREREITRFLTAWREQLAGCRIIVVEDNPEPTFEIGGENVTHLSWRDIERDLGTEAWIIPRRTDCVRSYGYWRAFEEGAEVLITLDDDCYPEDADFVATHLARLEGPGEEEAWVSTGKGMKPRGVPYYETLRRRRAVLNHGLWTNVPDFDAPTQLVNSRISGEFEPITQTIPRGQFFPMCGMNVAVRREVIPAFYFLLMGRDHPFDRIGDIWAGLFVKRICDHLGLAVQSGPPLVHHARASNVWANLRKECASLPVNETLWQAIDGVVLTATTFRDCYRELAAKLPMEGEYWEKLKRAIHVWTDLFPAG